MQSVTNSTANSQIPAQPIDSNTETSYWSRLTCINWEKMILFSNTALILSGIAFAFFMKLPMLALFLGGYGIAYVYLTLYAQQRAKINSSEVMAARKERDVAQQALADSRASVQKLEADKENLIHQHGSVQSMTSQRTKMDEKLKAGRAEFGRLKAQNEVLQNQNQQLNQAFDRLIAEAKEDKNLARAIGKARKILGGQSGAAKT